MLSIEEKEIILLSLKSASLAICLSLIPAIALAKYLSRSNSNILKTLCETLISIPMVVPPVVTGYILLLALGRNGILGPLLKLFNLQIPFSFYALVLASAVVSFPLLVNSIRTAFEMINKGYEEVSWTLGQSKLETFIKITLPLAFPGLISGIILAFARGMGEFGASITLAGNIQSDTRTLPLAIFTNLQTPGQESEVIRLVLISIIISMVAILVSSLLKKRLLKIQDAK
jgi:molybdate transport system permease protein